MAARAAKTQAPPETNGHFTFTPTTGAPITVPSIETVIPAGRQRWFFWKLRRLQGLEQPIFWLEQAGIADDLQEQIMLLDDVEWQRFFKDWMGDSGSNGNGASPGE